MKSEQNGHGITINLCQDWANHLRQLLASEGHVLDGRLTPSEVMEKYYSYEMRFPPACPRSIHKSVGFSCPAELSAGLQEIERKLMSGESIRPHLSTRVVSLSLDDDMLIDWGIYHLHLGVNPHPTRAGFTERTGPLLYCRLTSSDAYFIGILGHGQWTNKQLIKVLHDNWPSTIESYRLKGVVELSHDPSSDDISLLRASHINTCVQLEPGVIYSSIGLGFMTSGLPMRARIQTDNAARWLQNAQQRVLNQEMVWRSKAKEQDGHFNFRLVADEGTFYAIDSNQGVAIKLGTP